MRVGVALPANLPGVDGERVLEWARRAEELGFASIAVLDRLDYPNLEPLMSLAAAAAVTQRIALHTSVLLAPERPAPWVAKEIATLTRFAPGRVVLGVGVGARPIDYEVAGVPWSRRGAILDEQLALLDRMRAPADPAQDLGPVPGELTLLVGGASPGALRRMVAHGHGYVSGGLAPRIFAHETAAVRAAWRTAGREGEPLIWAGTWYSSPERRDEADRAREAYFVKGGPPPQIRDSIRSDRDEVRRAVEEFGEADQIVFNTLSPALEELAWLAETVEVSALARA